MDGIIRFIKKQPKWILFLVFFGIFNDFVTTLSLNALSDEMAQYAINHFIPKNIVKSINPDDLAQLNQRNSFLSSVILFIFIGWDFAAYISLFFRKNWGRKFIQAIAVCGLILTGGIIYAQMEGKLPAGISGFSLYFNYLSLPFYIWVYVVLMKNRHLFIDRDDVVSHQERSAEKP